MVPCCVYYSSSATINLPSNLFDVGGHCRKLTGNESGRVGSISLMFGLKTILQSLPIQPRPKFEEKMIASNLFCLGIKL